MASGSLPQPPQKPAPQKRAQVTRIRARETGSVSVLDADQLIVETARGLRAFRSYLREVVERRHLIGVLSGRQLKSNYEMNIVGFAWWLLEPLSLTAVYYILISILQSQSLKQDPTRLLFILCAVLPFKWLTAAVVGSMGVVRSNASLVNDVYFPRSLLPITEIVVGLAHFGVGLLVLPIFMAVLHVGPSWALVWLPVVIAVQMIFMLGLVYPLSVWGLNYRNLPNLMGNILRLWFYLSPALWRIKAEWPANIRFLIKLNPLSGIFTGYRDVILDHKIPDWTLYYSALVGAVLALIGAWYFSRREAQFGKML